MILCIQVLICISLVILLLLFCLLGKVLSRTNMSLLRLARRNSWVWENMRFLVFMWFSGAVSMLPPVCPFEDSSDSEIESTSCPHALIIYLKALSRYWYASFIPLPVIHLSLYIISIFQLTRNIKFPLNKLFMGFKLHAVQNSAVESCVSSVLTHSHPELSLCAVFQRWILYLPLTAVIQFLKF